MRVLLTGATGFIGSHVARELIGRGHEVTAILRTDRAAQRSDGLPDTTKRITVDLQAASAVDLKGPEPDILIHLAWYCEPSDYRTSPVNTAWPAASMRILESAQRLGCKRAVMAGTCFEYACGRGLFSETDPIAPINLYASSKAALYQMAAKYCQERDISLIWARPFYLYGPNENPNRLVPYVINHLLNERPCPLTEGDQVRDFLHVSDVASAICDAAISDVEGPVNIGSSIPVTVFDVAREIGSQLGRLELLQFGAQPTPPGDPPFICADNSRLTRQTPWRPRFDLETGIADSIEWWRARRSAE